MDLKNKRLLDISELMEYTGLGKTGATKWGKDNGCIVRVGRRVLYDRVKVDKAIDSMGSRE